MNLFRAFRIHEVDKKVVSRLETIGLDDLNAGNVVIKVMYSSINYKDALAATGAGRILKRFPLVGGIDLAGTIESSQDDRFAVGQHVLATGCGMSETHDGGYTEIARVHGDWVVPIPEGLGAFKAMAIGTAGFTAAMAIHKMEHNGLTPGRGPVLVTGATGGVGSIAIDMLASRGYEVVALTGKANHREYLVGLGARRVLLRSEVVFGSKPLESAQFAGAIDNLGGDVLGWLTRVTADGGCIASIGLAAGNELKTTVLPFILRGVNLLGINAAAQQRSERLVTWHRIATELMPRHILEIARKTITLDQLPAAFSAYLSGAVVGRTVVKIS